MQSKYVIHYHSRRIVDTAIMFDFQIYGRQNVISIYGCLMIDDDKTVIFENKSNNLKQIQSGTF